MVLTHKAHVHLLVDSMICQIVGPACIMVMIGSTAVEATAGSAHSGATSDGNKALLTGLLTGKVLV